MMVGNVSAYDDKTLGFSIDSYSPLIARTDHKSSLMKRSPVISYKPSIKQIANRDHFHYDRVEIGTVTVVLMPSGDLNLNELEPVCSRTLSNGTLHDECDLEVIQMRLQVESNGKKWLINRSLVELSEFDRQLHRCIFDRNHSHLEELCETNILFTQNLRQTIETYLERLSQITGSRINCFPVLKFLEVDSKGNRYLPAEKTPINTPAIACAVVTKDFVAQTCEQLSLHTGDIVSIIEKAPPDESGRSWWKAKLTIARSSNSNEILSQNFEVGIFPSDCVQIFNNKLETRYDENVNEVEQIQGRTQRRPIVWPFFKRNIGGESNALNAPLFGTDLISYLRETRQDVPIILKKCVEVIEQHGIVTGIYRQCGVQSNIQRLRNGFDSGKMPNLYAESILKDIHCVSSLLKQYFRQLPNPLFTFKLYPEFVCAYDNDEDIKINQFKGILERLPDEHYRTAKYLFYHLYRICQLHHLTDMNSKNLAIVWAPNLFRCPHRQNDGDTWVLQGLNAQTGLCNFLLKNAVYLFSIDTSESERSSNESVRTTFTNDQLNTPCVNSTKCLEPNDGPSSLPVYRTVISRPNRKDQCETGTGTWKRLLGGSSVDNPVSNLRIKWKICDEKRTSDYGNKSQTIKSRRRSSNGADVLSTKRSTSLISFVTRNFEEFHNRITQSWRNFAATGRPGRDISSPPGNSSLTAVDDTSASCILHGNNDGETIATTNDSTSCETFSKQKVVMNVDTKSIEMYTEMDHNASTSSSRNKADHLSGSSCEEISNASSIFERNGYTERTKRSITFATVNGVECYDGYDEERRSTSEYTNSDGGSNSVNFELSRYDNVSPQPRHQIRYSKNSRFLHTFYDLPNAVEKKRSTTKLYYF